jgi:hypothetical protein
MSRRANCWDNAPQESLFGHMRDGIRISEKGAHKVICAKIDDRVDYYDNDRPQIGMLKLTPSEYWEYSKTGVYPLSTPIPKPRA